MKDEFVRRVGRLQAATRSVVKGASQIEVVDTPLWDGRVRLERGSDGAVDILDDSGGSGIRGKRYPASSERPSGYPADLPFLPNRPSSLILLPGKRRRILSWSAVEGPSEAVAALDSAVLDVGWQRRSHRRWLFGLIRAGSEHERGAQLLRVSAYRFPGRGTKLRAVVEDSSVGVFDAA